MSAETLSNFSAFLESRKQIEIEAADVRLYYTSEPKQTCWDAGGMADQAAAQDANSTGWWFHPDTPGESLARKHNTFRVKQNETLTLVELTFRDKHASLWKQIMANVNAAPDLLTAGAVDTSFCSPRHHPYLTPWAGRFCLPPRDPHVDDTGP